MSETVNPIDILDVQRFIADVLKNIKLGTEAANNELRGGAQYEPGDEVPLK